MDRSYLSQPSIVKVSRAFVCIRLATYENKAEAEFTKKLWRGNREIENTTFAVLAPDGEKLLLRATRSPRHEFRSPDDLADWLTGTAVLYLDAKPLGDKNAALPKAENVRIGSVIAASENLPLVLIRGENAAQIKKLEAKLSQLAWSKDHIGRFVYVSTDAKDLKTISGLKGKSGIAIVQIDKFGLKGTVLAQTDAGSDEKALAKTLSRASTLHHTFQKSMFSHLREGTAKGVFWKTKLPVTDPMEEAARQRTKRAIENRRK